jgi:putative ABC transport system ATP-binding protein
MSVPRRPLFEAKQLSKSYPMGDSVVHALRGIDLQLFEGEFVVILGASAVSYTHLRAHETLS